MRKDQGFLQDKSFFPPFFSESVLASIRIILGLSCLTVVCFWPASPMINFRFSTGTPLIFPAFFIFSLVFCGHHLMSFARAEYQRLPGNCLTAMGDRYVRRIIMVMLRHTISVHALLAPFYLIIAAVSGISLKLLGYSMVILLLSGLLCAMIGLFSLVLAGPLNLWGFFISRILFIMFLTLTGVMNPLLNPIYIIYIFFRHHGHQPPGIGEIAVTHCLFVSLLTLSLTVICRILILRKGGRPV